MMHYRFIIAVSCWAAFLLCAAVGAAEPDELISDAKKAAAMFRLEIERLATLADGDGNAEQAKRFRLVLPLSSPDRLYLPALPVEFGVSAWEPVLTDIRTKYAEEQFQRAKQAATKNRGNLAMQLAIAAIEANPDHEGVRTLLGFRLYENTWRTAWEIDRLQKGFVDHPVFGWIPKEHVDRYEKGERFVKPNRWVSSEEDAKIHAKIANGWLIDTEHYQLLTNHGLEVGVRHGRRLENLYRAWKLLFFRFQLSDETLSKLFRGTSSGGTPPRHQVRLYRDKNDYVLNLQDDVPSIAMSGGFYDPMKRISHFFPVDPSMSPDVAEYIHKTLYHEGTHQLFQETRLTSKTPGATGNFWLVEGIAMFMETIRKDGNHYIVGDSEDIRLYAAKKHKNEGRFYIPFETLVKMGLVAFQTDPEIQKLYSQSAGMTHFLMLTDDGRYRDAVIQLLRLIYAGTDRPDSLPRLTDRSFMELDKGYERFLQSL